MSAELFPVEESLSPRLTWLKLHNLALGELPDGQRFCAGEDLITHGDTHSDCEHKMAEELEIAHWSIAAFIRAGVVFPTAVEEEMA